MGMQLYMQRFEDDRVTFGAGGAIVRLNGFYPQVGVDEHEPVVEHFDLLLYGTSDELRALQRQITNLFHAARRYKADPEPVWLYFSPDESAAAWRAKVLDGGVILSAGLDPMWRVQRLRLTVTVEREPLWQGPETQLPLTNWNAESTLGPLTIFNCNDGAGVAPNRRCNFVEIDGDDIPGDAPALARIEITNTLDHVRRAANVMIGLNVESSPTLFNPVLEAEAATGGTTQASAGGSGGSVKLLTWSGTAESVLLTWTLPTALLNQMGGNYFRAIGRFTSSIAPTCWVRLRVKLALTTIWESPFVALSEFVFGYELLELCSLRLPPYMLGTGDLYPLTLELIGKDTTGAGSLTMDYLQLTPLSGWRKLIPMGYHLPYGARLVDDGIAGRLYVDGLAEGGRVGHYIGYGERIRLEPGRPQRLYFLMSNDVSSSEITRTAAVKVFIRPQRWAL